MAAAGYFLPGLVHGDIRSRQYTTSRRKEEGNGEMEECSKEKETRKEKGGRRSKARRAVEEALYAFLSSRGFVCNNLCGQTA